jgi:hypothetical protein
MVIFLGYVSHNQMVDVESPPSMYDLLMGSHMFPHVFRMALTVLRVFTCHVDQQPWQKPRVWTLLISVYIYLCTGGRYHHGGRTGHS